MSEADGSSVVDPWDDVDALEELAERIAVLAAHIHAAEHELLVLVAEYDRRRGWELDGHRSCAYWLAARTGIGLAAAREKVRVARALEELPATSEAMARGRISLCAARALTRVATPENEVELLEAADGCTVAKLEKMVRAYRVGSAEDEAERERRQWDSRTLSVFFGDDGMAVVSGRLTAEVGALFMRAMDAASDALYAAERPNPLESEQERLKAAAQRRADALRLLAERGLAVGFGGPARQGAEEASADRGGRGSEDACGCHPLPAPISGSRAERYQVGLRIDASALASPENAGRRHLDDGTGVSYETSRRLTCDAAIVPMFEGSNGELLDLGRRTRTSPAASGARGARFTDGHHIDHWADGGETSLSNTLLLCWYHHHLVHEGGWSVSWWGEGRPVFHDPRGGVHFDGGWEPPALPEKPAAALVTRNLLKGVDPDGWENAARWEPDGPVPIEVEGRFAAAVFEGSP
jgi:hypothetical protein